MVLSVNVEREGKKNTKGTKRKEGDGRSWDAFKKRKGGGTLTKPASQLFSFFFFLVLVLVVCFI